MNPEVTPPPPARTLTLIGAANGMGAPDSGCAEGPDALRRYRVFHDTPLQRVKWESILRVPHPAQDAPLHALAAFDRRLAHTVEHVLREGNFPLVLGGDHTCGIGTWSGVHRALATRGPIGLIWIDAHMDSHTFTTTPSGHLHGMPLAALLGHGDALLTHIDGATAKLRPEHVCLIGVRSYEAGEAALLRKLGVRVFGMDAVRRHGLESVFAEALATARKGTVGYGISIDLDALDPGEAPGVGTPVRGGLQRAELTAALTRLRGAPDFVAMEIVEYNPHRDHHRLTADAVAALVGAVIPLSPARAPRPGM